MSDTRISELFAEGSAPERDPAFVASVTADIGRARLRIRLVKLALPVTGVLALSGALYVAAGVIRPLLSEQLEGAPQFMGVPMPVAIGALAAGLALSARRFVISR